MGEQWGNYSVDYSLDGSQWSMPVRATSAEDAKRRIDRAAAFGNITGPWSDPIPAWHGWLWVPLIVWWRNWRQRNVWSR